MDEEIFKNIAKQLRQPEGAYAIEVGERMNEGNLHINLFTIEALNLKGDENILEIGMGNGFFVKNILDQYTSVQYSGCDYSSIMVEESAKRNKEFVAEGRANFYFGMADNLPFKAQTFDTIFTINTLYFWEDITSVFNELRRVLKPDGQIAIAIRPKSVMENYPFVKYGFVMFEKGDLIKLVEGNNFICTQVLELEEPQQELNGIQMPVSTLLISAVKKVI